MQNRGSQRTLVVFSAEPRVAEGRNSCDLTVFSAEPRVVGGSVPAVFSAGSRVALTVPAVFSAESRVALAVPAVFSAESRGALRPSCIQSRVEGCIQRRIDGCRRVSAATRLYSVQNRCWKVPGIEFSR